MKILVRAKPKAKENTIQRISQPKLDFDSNGKEEMATYKISVKALPVNGKANEAIVKIIAEYFDTSPSFVKLISGQNSKQKIFDVNTKHDIINK